MKRYPIPTFGGYRTAKDSVPALVELLPQMTVRIGAVSYLNTKPLIYGLSERLPQAKLQLDLPSRLAERLSNDELDIALIPSVEFLRGDDLAIISDACIACRGPVRSVRMLFKVPPSEVKTLALDEGSRTSAALGQVLLAQRTGVRPALSRLDIRADYRRSNADAIVLIGDRAMEVEQGLYVENWDLGEEWNNETGLPFVFAMWVASRQSVDRGIAFEVAEALRSCRTAGLGNVDEIVDLESARYALSKPDCRRYFMEQLHFTLGDKELRGLELFRDRAVSLGLVPAQSHQLALQTI